MKHFHRYLVLASTFTFTACADDTSSADDAAEGDSEGQAPRQVTYYDDALPVFAQHCNSCHTADGLGPFALDEPEVAAQWAPAVLAAIESRTMPPFGVDNSGACNTFLDARWVSEEEMQTVRAWVEQGTVAGEPPAEEIRPPAPIVLEGDDVFAMSTPTGYVPVPEAYAGGETEDYQCFLMEPATDVDRFITGFDVIPGNAATVHHVVVYEVDPDALGNGASMAELDEQSPDQPGWDCLGGVADDVYPESVPVAWAPGVGATNFPWGMGIRLEAGHVLVVQMHYDLSQSSDPGVTRVDVALADEVEQEGLQVLWDPFLFSDILGNPESLPAGQPEVRYSWSETLSGMLGTPLDAELDLIGVLPHMHTRGRRMDIDLALGADDEMTCGADVDRYEFGWQRSYFFETPIPVRGSDTMAVTCTWDTTRDESDVFPGFGTDDEMCLVGVIAILK
jgi:mono/diheme cytochrome c family protein